MLEQLKEDVCEGNLALLKHGLVTWTSGNLSAFDPQSRLVVIKPSGVLYEELTPADMVVVDLTGKVVEGRRGPSSDTGSHLTVYRGRSELRAIVHTHSNYATAFAAAGRGIPCVLTAIADEFGGAIPCGDYAEIGGDEIGNEILRVIGESPAVLMKQHGVFTVGKSITACLKAAVMVEDVAKTVAIAISLGGGIELTSQQIQSNFDRYQHRYGIISASKGVTK